MQKPNVVADALSLMTMGTVYHVEKRKKKVVKDFPRLAWLGVHLEDSPNGSFMVHHNYDSLLVVEVKSKQHLDPQFMVLKASVQSKLNE